MLSTTLHHLICIQEGRNDKPCGGILEAFPHSSEKIRGTSGLEIRSGVLRCTDCEAHYPILAGVALLVRDPVAYLHAHIKGIARAVPAETVPAEYKDDYLEAKSILDESLKESGPEHIEEDLESERVNALYVMNHYLRTQPRTGQPWWKPLRGAGKANPVMDSLIRKYWDHGPFVQIEKRIARLTKKSRGTQVLLELGCGVGGLYPQLKPYLGFYLGADTSFASIALARHLALGMPYTGTIKMPGDLLDGSVSRPARVKRPPSGPVTGDFIVADMGLPPVHQQAWDFSVVLNAIDMMDEPWRLPHEQHSFLKKGGFAIQSCPYIWHQNVSLSLRERLPRTIRDSARAVEWLYEQEGFKVGDRMEHLPWLFFKNLRQLEVYSVHLFTAKRI